MLLFVHRDHEDGHLLLSSVCLFTSTEARWLVNDGDRGGRGRKSEGSTADTPEEDRRDRGPPPEQWKC